MVYIKFLGHSCFRIRGKDTSVITDPYDPKKVGLKLSKKEADIVTISHDHSDHNYTKGVKKYNKVISGPGEYEVQGVSFLGFSSYHDDKKGKERGKNTIYVIEIDNIRIAHLGDLGHELKEKKLSKLGDIDVLMIPVGGVYTIDASTATKVARDIEPSVIIPMHYQMKGLKKDTFEKLTGTKPFVNDLGLPVEKTKKYSVKSTTVPDEQKIVIIEKS